MAKAEVKGNAYQLEKLAALARENRAAVDALKADTANAKPEDVLALTTRAHKIEKRLKVQKRMERALGLRMKPVDGGP